jgi:hypothetical protein
VQSDDIPFRVFDVSVHSHVARKLHLGKRELATGRLNTGNHLVQNRIRVEKDQRPRSRLMGSAFRDTSANRVRRVGKDRHLDRSKHLNL